MKAPPMCATNHDGTCAAVLSRSKTQPAGFEAKLVCDSCNEVVKVVGFVEHTVNPVLAAIAPEALERAA
jgi:hypothetical protein